MVYIIFYISGAAITFLMLLLLHRFNLIDFDNDNYRSKMIDVPKVYPEYLVTNIRKEWKRKQTINRADNSFIFSLFWFMLVPISLIWLGFVGVTKVFDNWITPLFSSKD